MLTRLVIFIGYFFVLFLFSRIFEYSATVMDIVGLRLICDIIPTMPWTFYSAGDASGSKDRSHSSASQTSHRDSSNDKVGDDKRLKLEEEDPINFSLEQNVEFTSYSNLKEYVEDTKASVWLVFVEPVPRIKQKYRKKRALSQSQHWSRLVRKLAYYGVRTGVYRCLSDPTLCMKYKVDMAAILLTMPKGLQPKGKVKVELFRLRNEDFSEEREQNLVYMWIQRKLQSKVATVKNMDYASNLESCRASFDAYRGSCPMLDLVYQSRQSSAPLFLSILSVKFTGRIRFLHIKDTTFSSEKLVVVGNSSLLPGTDLIPSLNYTYGGRKGENFRYTNIDMFLRMLHPEVNDIFMFAIIIVNMFCSLEFIIQKGGPLRRTLYLLWIMMFANTVLLFSWLPLMQLSQTSVAKPIVDTGLKILQVLMVSEAASMVREDMIHLTQHVHVILIGFVCYGLLCGLLKYRITYGSSGSFRPLLWIHEDLSELQQMFHSLLSLQQSRLHYFILEESVERFLHRLSIPDLWLHPPYAENFFNELPEWKFCQHMITCRETKLIQGKTQHTCNAHHCSSIDCQISFKGNADEIKEPCTEDSDHKEALVSDICGCNSRPAVPYLIITQECSICLDNFCCGTFLKILPCGHMFHNICIRNWLYSGDSSRHLRCPLCRWPMYKQWKFAISNKSVPCNPSSGNTC